MTSEMNPTQWIEGDYLYSRQSNGMTFSHPLRDLLDMASHPPTMDQLDQLMAQLKISVQPIIDQPDQPTRPTGSTDEKLR